MPFADDLEAPDAEIRISKQFDKFGIEMLYPSLPGGREFYLPILHIDSVYATNRILDTEMVVHGGGSVNPGASFYLMNGSPRLYVYSTNTRLAMV